MLMDVDGIIDQFLHPTVSVISRSPPYHNILENNTMLNANVTLIHSNLGYVDQDHQILIIMKAQLNRVSTTLFIKSIHLPTQPIIPDKSTLAERENIARVHKSNIYLWKKNNTVEKSLSQQLL